MERNGTERPAITVDGLTKRYGRATVVEGLSFEVRKGAVTGFLGANGAGKTTALKAVAGLARPSSGRVLVDGTPVERLRPDARTLGAHIEPCGAHPGRTGRAHLRSLALLAGLPGRRVGEVLELVGLGGAARRRVGTYSLGMRQRLGLAAALLGDPDILVLDEPVNGLDPQGIRWLRTLVRDRAAAGRTVLLSSHQLGEAARTVDEVVVIDRGRLVHAGPIGALKEAGVSVLSPEPARLAAVLGEAGARIGPDGDGALLVEGLDAARIAALAAREGVPVHGLTPRSASLEDVFFDLTGGSAS